MSASVFQYSADLCRRDGTKLGSELLPVDWEPALECVRFEALKLSIGQNAGFGEGEASARGRCRITPTWDPHAGQPRVAGFRVSLDLPGGGVAEVDFPKSYFRDAARKASTGYVASGQLEAGDVLHFVPSAHPAAAAAPSRADGLVAGEVTGSWPVSEARLADLRSRSVAGGADEAGDVAVVLPDSVLGESARRSRDAGDVETGGVLVGHLRCDPDTRELFVEVTAQIPARHTVAEMTSLSFTPGTWTDARRILAMRARGEVMLGWWHSHLGRAVCRGCPAESQQVCQFSRGFFSSHDRHFQRTAFSRAYHLGLVVNDPAHGDVSWSLFGWRFGEIALRGYRVTRSGAAGSRSAPAAAGRAAEVDARR